MMKKFLMMCLICGTLAGCGLEMYPGGDLPTKARLNAVKKGDSKEKVLQILGTPATESPTLNGSDSFVVYAQNMKRSNAFLEPTETKRDVYVYYFNNKDVLTDVAHLTLADKADIAYDTEITPTGGKELSVWEEMVQNFGRYNSGAQDSATRR